MAGIFTSAEVQAKIAEIYERAIREDEQAEREGSNLPKFELPSLPEIPHTEALKAGELLPARNMRPATTQKRHVTVETIKKAEGILEQYKRERQALTDRIIENNQYFEFTATSGRPRQKSCCGKFKPSQSAYLFNSIINKHADFMDNMPSPVILPREESDEKVAKTLSVVVPAIMEKSKFGESWSENCYEKLVGGTAVYATVWDGSAENGLGEILVRRAELINLFWKGGISEINESPNLFYVSVMDNDELELRYPKLHDKTGSGSVLNVAEFIYEDRPDRTSQSLVVDWYYKKPVEMINGAGMRVVKYVLHYCIFSCGEVLYASEDDYNDDGTPRYPDGFYRHGRYPYTVDVMFPLKGSMAGFGYVDIMKNPQEFIDDIDTAIRKNTKLKSVPKVMAPVGAGIRGEDLLDPDKTIVQYAGSRDQIQPVETPDIPASVFNFRTGKIDELKETSGNRDFSQGSTAAGVTAASAIAALQEAGSKLSRDMIKQSYFAYAQICELVIELIRQFYTVSRVIRITDANEKAKYERVSGSMLTRRASDPEFGIASGDRELHFDVKVNAQKASPFSRAAQNELAKELYGAGFFNPQIADQVLVALDMMEFDGKDKIVAKVQENAQLMNENQMLKNQIVQMANMLASAGGDTSRQLAAAIAQKYGMEGGQPVPAGVDSQAVRTNSLGGEESRNTRVEKARQQARDRNEVQA